MTRWQRFLCNFLDWHRPAQGSGVEFDGCTAIARCERCGRRIGLDGQGNWFRMGPNNKDARNDD